MAVIIGLLLQFNLQAADAPPITLHVETAGTLPTLIAESKKFEITNLTLTGNLNGTDIRYIREMAGRNVTGVLTNGKLSVLNLAEANIVSGGDYYYRYYDSSWREYFNYYTANNSISTHMFRDFTKLTSITISNSVTSIEQRAFSGCTGLTSVTFGNSVTSIGYEAFRGCTGLTSITIGNGSIGGWAFEGCTGLTSVTIGNSVTEIGWSAFSGCTGLTSVTIGNSVTSIEERAFSGCTGLTSITIPNSVTSLSGFSGCTGLTSITIGNSVTSIEERAFNGCTGLTSVTIGNDVTSIGSDAFWGCTGLTSVIIPNRVTSLSGFRDCIGLTEITIPNSVTSIGSDAFTGCTGLKKIYTTNSVPPTCVSYTFSNVSKTDCILYVPIGSFQSYWLANGWGDFKNIVEMDMTSISVDNITADNFNTYMHGNTLIIEGAEQNMNITVYTISGQIIYQTIANGKADIPLNTGAYIVRVNNESQKVIVK